MADPAIDKPDRELLARRLRAYLKDELDVEIGGLDAEFLLDFMAERIGPRFYNQGLRDAATALAKRMDVLAEALEELERPVPRD
ncbi:MAG: DUF2164 domain-containing protein [Caulobacterales bacterium]|nr:DUF2164 domain-containing protein [Caulobacterales bacterium]